MPVASTDDVLLAPEPGGGAVPATWMLLTSPLTPLTPLAICAARERGAYESSACLSASLMTWGAPKWPPQSDQRSDRPGEPVAVLDVGLRSMTLRRAAGAAACREAAPEYAAAWSSRAAQAWQAPQAR